MTGVGFLHWKINQCFSELGRVALVAQRPIVVKLSRRRAAYTVVLSYLADGRLTVDAVETKLLSVMAGAPQATHGLLAVTGNGRLWRHDRVRDVTEGDHVMSGRWGRVTVNRNTGVTEEHITVNTARQRTHLYIGYYVISK